MKNIPANIFYSILTISLLASCAVQKRRYLKGFYLQHVVKKTNSSSIDISYNRSAASSNRSLSAWDISKTNSPPYADPSACYDTVVMKSGEKIAGKVNSLKKRSLVFVKCGSSEIIKTKTKNVRVVKFQNSQTGQYEIKRYLPKPHPFAYIAFFSGLLSLILGVFVPWLDPEFLVSPLTFLISFVFAILALRKINRQPEKYNGEILAYISLTGGLVFIYLLLAVLASLLLSPMVREWVYALFLGFVVAMPIIALVCALIYFIIRPPKPPKRDASGESPGDAGK